MGTQFSLLLKEEGFKAKHSHRKTARHTLQRPETLQAARRSYIIRQARSHYLEILRQSQVAHTFCVIEAVWSDTASEEAIDTTKPVQAA